MTWKVFPPRSSVSRLRIARIPLRIAFVPTIPAPLYVSPFDPARCTQKCKSFCQKGKWHETHISLSISVFFFMCASCLSYKKLQKLT